MNKNCDFGRLCYAKALNSIKNGDITNAIPELNRSVKLDGTNIEALNLLGFCLYSLCEFESAEDCWGRSISVRPRDNKAYDYMEIIKSEGFRKIKEQYESGIANFEQGDYKNAAFKMLNITAKKKELIKPYIVAGISMAKMGDIEEGISYIEKGLQKDKGNIEARKYMGALKNEKTEANFTNIKKEKAKSLGTDFGIARQKPQWIQAKKGSKIFIVGIIILVAALSWTFYIGSRSDLKKDKNNKEATQTNAEDQIEKLKKEHFEPENEKPVQESVQPDAGDGGNTQGASEAGEVPRTIENEQEYYSRALKLYREGKYTEAAPMFSEIAKYGQQENYVSESVFLAALSYEKSGDIQNALYHYRIYIQNYKNGGYYDDSLYNMGIMLYESGDVQGASEVLTRLKNEHPESEYFNSKVRQILSEQ